MSREKDLEKALEETFQRWIEKNGLYAAVPVAWICVLEGRGVADDGDSTETTMIVPFGSSNHLLGLLRNAQLRIESDLLSDMDDG